MSTDVPGVYPMSEQDRARMAVIVAKVQACAANDPMPTDLPDQCIDVISEHISPRDGSGRVISAGASVTIYVGDYAGRRGVVRSVQGGMASVEVYDQATHSNRVRGYFPHEVTVNPREES